MGIEFKEAMSDMIDNCLIILFVMQNKKVRKECHADTSFLAPDNWKWLQGIVITWK